MLRIVAKTIESHFVIATSVDDAIGADHQAVHLATLMCRLHAVMLLCAACAGCGEALWLAQQLLKWEGHA